LGLEVVAESNAVTDLQTAAGNELLNGIDRSETVVDQYRDLLEMTVECSDSEGHEQWLDIDPGEECGRVRQRVDEGLGEICPFRAGR
jgi:hypothetical protein